MKILTNCWKFVKIVNIFPCQNFMPYGSLLFLHRRQQLLDEQHGEDEKLACSYLRWPGVDSDIRQK